MSESRIARRIGHDLGVAERDIKLQFDTRSEIWLVVVDGAPEGGFVISDQGESEGSVAAAADQVQDHVIDALQRAWPKCPEHEHPLRPTVIDSQAVWVC